MKEKHISRVSLESNPGRQRKSTWGMKNEEYMADFLLVTKRTLGQFEWALFRYHFLLGADWKMCCRKLQMDRGEFFHEVYRIQQKLGRTFRELEPYALFPVDEYFGGAGRDPENLRPVLVPIEAAEPEPEYKGPSKFPIRKAA